jgi:Putative DNA-binding domain
MGGPGSPPWLSHFQREFGAVLREPLSVQSGRLEPNLGAYSPHFCAQANAGPVLSAAQRLAVYNRQYWLRLFEVLHHAYPLLTRLLGHWSMNQLATAYLQSCPPSGHDIDCVADALPAFARQPGALRRVKGALGSADEQMLWSGIELDAVWRAVFAAPAELPFRPSSRDMPRLMNGRLIRSRSWGLVSQGWPLLQLRARLGEIAGESPLAPPPALTEPEDWVVFRAGRAMGQLRVHPLAASLLRLLSEHPVPEALGKLECGLGDVQKRALPALVTQWLQTSVRLGCWTGVE